MKAAVLVEPRSIRIMDVPPPEPGPGEVLIKVSLAGICGSDHSLYNGKFNLPLPVIPGHEAIGFVHSLGSGGSRVEVGQRVTIQPNFPCRACPTCRAGYENVCPAKVRLGLDRDGVFAEYVTAPSDFVWPIPDGLSDEDAVLTEPLAVAAHALKIASPGRGDRVLIIGAGVIGLLAMQLALESGARITACDLDEKRLAFAQDLGASGVIRADGPLEPFHNAFDPIYEASGAPGALAQAIAMAAPGGRIVLLGLPGKAHPLSAEFIVRKELKIMGSMIYTDEFPEVLELLKQGRIQTGRLISDRLPLDGLDRALKEFSDPTRIKALVTIP